MIVLTMLSYAEAVKKVEKDGSGGRDPESSGVHSRAVPVQRNKPTSDIAMIINCTAGMERKLQKIEVMVVAAEVFGCARLDVRRVTGCVKW